MNRSETLTKNNNTNLSKDRYFYYYAREQARTEVSYIVNKYFDENKSIIMESLMTGDTACINNMHKSILLLTNELIEKAEYIITNYTEKGCADYEYWREYINEVCRMTGRKIPTYLK